MRGVDRDLARVAADRRPVGDVAGEDLLDLALGERGERVAGIDDHGDAVKGDDGGFHVHALGLCGRHLGGLGAAGGHADLGGAVDDGGDAGGGAFRGDLEAHAGILRLVLLGEHRDEFGAERVGALDDEFLGLEGGRGEDGRGEEEDFFHGEIGWIVWVRVGSRN